MSNVTRCFVFVGALLCLLTVGCGYEWYYGNPSGSDRRLQGWQVAIWLATDSPDTTSHGTQRATLCFAIRSRHSSGQFAARADSVTLFRGDTAAGLADVVWHYVIPSSRSQGLVEELTLPTPLPSSLVARVYYTIADQSKGTRNSEALDYRLPYRKKLVAAGA